MDKNLYDFLKNLNVSDDCFQLCKDGVLKEALYIPSSKTFSIHIHFNNMIKPELYNAILEIKKQIKFATQFVLSYDNLVCDLNYIKGIFTKVILSKYKNNAMMRTLKDLDIDFDDTNIYFNFDSKFQADSFIPYLEDIQSIYKFLGVNKKITYKTKEIDVSVVNQDIEDIKSVTVPIKNETKTLVKKDNNEYKIRELVSSENYVTTKGKIFFIEASERKKLIMTYYITDYEDSICVKCFESQRLNRELLTSLKEGSWVEVSGRVGYDTFSKDEVFTAKSIK